MRLLVQAVRMATTMVTRAGRVRVGPGFALAGILAGVLTVAAQQPSTEVKPAFPEDDAAVSPPDANESAEQGLELCVPGAAGSEEALPAEAVAGRWLDPTKEGELVEIYPLAAGDLKNFAFKGKHLWTGVYDEGK